MNVEYSDELIDYEDKSLKNRVFVGIFLSKIDANEAMAREVYEGQFRLFEMEEGCYLSECYNN